VNVIIFEEVGIPQTSSCRITVIFNNIPYVHELKTSWGFSCLVQGFGQTILFDTGGNGEIFLANMKHLGADPGVVDAVVLCHIHADHTGGLEALHLRALNIEKVAPSHCTGWAAIDRFREVWGADFLPGGCGAIIKLYP